MAVWNSQWLASARFFGLVAGLVAAFSVGCSAAGPVVWNEDGPLSVGYVTYLGGNGRDQLRELIAYPDGSALVTGSFHSSDMPTTPGVFQPEYAGDEPQLGHDGFLGGDAYVAVVAPDGKSLLRATYFGGSKQERGAYGMLLDAEGNVVLGGATRSPDLPTTAGAFQPRFGGGPADVYLAKMSPDLRELLWGTFVGGSGVDWPRGGIALDPAGNVYAVGRTESTDFPAVGGGVIDRGGRTDSDVMIVGVTADGSRLHVAGAHGGSDWDVAVGLRVRPGGGLAANGHSKSADFPVTRDAPQKTFAGVWDAILLELSGDAQEIRAATFLGGTADDYSEHRPSIARDGSFLVTGVESSDDFPATTRLVPDAVDEPGDGFVGRYSESGERIAVVRFGGSKSEFFLTPTEDAAGNIWVVGRTSSPDFPVTADALQPTFGGGESDGAIVVFDAGLTRILYATFIGGSGMETVRSIALGEDGDIFITGHTESRNFPVTEGALQSEIGQRSDGFVARFKLEAGAFE